MKYKTIFLLVFAVFSTSIHAAETLYFYHNDHLGIPQAMTDNSATPVVVWQADYKPFGKAAIVMGTITNNLRFPGQYYDVESGLHYNYFRDYDPSIGRYSQSDPIGLLGGINTYAYANDNPVRFIDFFGLSSVVYSPFSGEIAIVDSQGNASYFPAANNNTTTTQPFPVGTFPYAYHVPHTGLDANSSFGSNGNFVFTVPGRTGMGVHSGRANACDLANQCGVNFSTEGCIRTTDEATALLQELHFNGDPITHITRLPEGLSVGEQINTPNAGLDEIF